MRTVLLLLALALAGSDPNAQLTQYRADAKAANDALTRHDNKAAEAALRAALRDAPQRPAVVYNLASLEAAQGENADALVLLRRYAGMGIVNGAEGDADFPALAKAPAYKAVMARLDQARRAICTCETLFTGSADPFIAEGVARDGNRIFVAGVHARRILAIENGKSSDFGAQLPGGYSPFGMAVDRKRHLLWMAAAAITQSASGETGKSALIAFDLATGALVKVYPASGKLSFGDIALAPDGTVYVSESAEGSLFKLASGADALSPVGKPAMLASAQGMVVSKDGKTLLISDYAMGLLRVDLQTGALETIAIPSNVTTIGIDGMAPLADGSIIVTQNGFKTPRIVRLRLSPDWSRLMSLTVAGANAPEIADPSLITTDGKDAYVVGVAQWASFDDDKADPVRPTQPWKIVKIKLD